MLVVCVRVTLLHAMQTLTRNWMTTRRWVSMHTHPMPHLTHTNTFMSVYVCAYPLVCACVYTTARYCLSRKEAIKFVDEGRVGSQHTHTHTPPRHTDVGAPVQDLLSSPVPTPTLRRMPDDRSVSSSAGHTQIHR